MDREEPGLFLRAANLVIPNLLEHALGDLEKFRCRLQRREQLLELAFNHVAPDRLSVALTAALGAEIVGMARSPSLGPTRRQRVAAVVADDITAQREVLPQVLPARHPADAIEPVLDAPPGFERDQTFMLSLPQLDAPFRHFEITRV
ncbi:hypothetical protein NGM99_17095 [Mesorhizobium sp. RP14(2022)]|uniref:Transposase n=1 Tax=Mesorhizobium liriopis TaxID=2953882 RepID=A0ABT1CAI5_9HYPH|nr:hypothetical protein [Mesorhizobium liriopis]MCO6051503.1 hypothetical protein [Mesorhizobium liriopis]